MLDFPWVRQRGGRIGASGTLAWLVSIKHRGYFKISFKSRWMRNIFAYINEVYLVFSLQ
jgi:hypothetical protein